MNQGRTFAGPATLSTAALALMAPIGLLAAVISDPFADGRTILIWLLAGTIAQVGLTLVILLARTCGAGHRPSTVVATVLAASFTRALIITVLLPVLGAGDPIGATNRLIGATFTISMWALLIGAVVESITRTRRQLRELSSRVDITLAEADALQQALVHEVNTAATATVQDLARAAQAVHRAIDTRLRPLSHRLWFGVTDPQLRWRTLTRIAAEPVPIMPATIILTWSLLWNTAMRFGFASALEVTIVTMVPLVAVLLLGRLLILRLAIPAAIGNPASVVLATVISMVTLGTFPLTNSIQASDDVSGWLGVSLANLVFLFAAMAIASTAHSRTAAIEELTDAVADLQPRRRAAASFLHNSVNSTWRALAMQLEIASQTGDVERARQLLADMRAPATEAQFIAHERAEAAAMFAQADRWEGVAHVSVDVEGDVPAPLRSSISQLVDEAITNAVRHGRARHVEAFITVSPEHVDIVVVDDGSWDSSSENLETGGGTGRETGRGLGTAWLDTQGAWSREHGAAGTRLTVRLPCLP